MVSFAFETVAFTLSTVGPIFATTVWHSWSASDLFADLVDLRR